MSRTRWVVLVGTVVMTAVVLGTVARSRPDATGPSSSASFAGDAMTVIGRAPEATTCRA